MSHLKKNKQIKHVKKTKNDKLKLPNINEEEEHIIYENENFQKNKGFKGAEAPLAEALVTEALVTEALVTEIIEDLDTKIAEAKAETLKNKQDIISGSKTPDNSFDYFTNTFDVIDTILTQHNKRELVNHQHSSYKQFIEKDIGDIIRQFNTRKLYFGYDTNANKHKLELHIDFLNYNLGRPTIHENDGSFKVMRPDIAKLRNLTYSSPLTLNLKLTRIMRSSSITNSNKSDGIINTVEETLNQEDIKEEYFNNINFGRIPIMVLGANCVLNKKDGTNLEQNGECPYDLGGYFIIGGNEKVIIAQERIAENEAFVFNNQKKIKGKEIEIRCASDQYFSVVVANVIRYVYRDECLELDLPNFKTPVPIFLLLKAFGVTTDKKLFEFIAWDLNDDIGKFLVIALKPTFEKFKKICKTNSIETNAEQSKFQEIMLGYLKYKNTNREIRMSHEDKMQYLNKVLEDEILPHIGKSLVKKIKYIGYMCRKLLLVQFEYLPYDDRDAYDNKRVDTPGRLLSTQFRQCFNKLVKDMVKSVSREIKNNKSRRDVFDLITSNNIYKIIKPTIIDGGLKYALATGNWGIKTSGKGNVKAGTAQVLNRLSYQSFVSHLRRVNSPSDKTGSNGKIVKPRKLHGTSWGYLCPCETPEGQPVGLVKNLTLISKITANSNSIIVRTLLLTLDIKLLEDITPIEISNNCLVFVNGDWIGVHAEPDKLVKQIRSERRQANINIFTGVYWNMEHRTVKIYTDSGRLVRPVYIVDAKNKLRITDSYFEKLKETKFSFNFLISPKFYEQNRENNFDPFQKETIASSWGTEGIIEYIDTNEVNNTYIAMTNVDMELAKEPYINEYTHCEIHPGLMLGAVAAVIPFSDDNQSPRNCYQCLGLDETVLMADYSKKYIKNVVIGDEVFTFHPKTLEISTTKVIHQFVRPTDKKIYKITVENILTKNWIPTVISKTMISIIATEDHKFMCINNGIQDWMEVKDIILNIEHIKIGFIDFVRFEIELLDQSYIDNKYVLENHYKFHNIFNIIEVENQLVCDITVESENHSFFTGNGFLSSNCAMGKQSIGLFARNFLKRMDTLAYVANNLEKALVKTKFAKYINYDEVPCGLNAMVAIGCYTGYNMEDSVLLNQSAVDRGLFRATFYRTYKDDEKKIQSSGREEKFAKPNVKYTRGTKPGNYNKLDERGIVRKDEYVTSDDIIIGKVLPLKNKFDDNGHQLYKDCSTNLRTNETGFVDKIYSDRNADGFRFVKIRMRTERTPIIGDKFASRCAQKGTVGMTYPQEQMPFNAEGISPDIIMNPHAIPSRMTIGQLMECILGKASSILGGYSDCTPFNKVPYDKVCDILEANGLNYSGDEIMYSGITGQQMDVKLFFGPTYYQRLKHMVLDKIHSRSSGPVVQLTRQPAEGRSRDGGLRFGEMERDCLNGETHISSVNQLSIKIKDFDNQIENQYSNVLGWDAEKKGMTTSKQTNFLYKGEKECVDVYLEDGRKITCTPEHRLLVSNGEWVKANELKINDMRLICSVKYPVIDVKEEIRKCNNWNFKISDNLTLKTNTQAEYYKSLAFARILGYFITDGYIGYKGNSYDGCIYLGHKLDVELILTDIKLFTHITQTDFTYKNLYMIRLPRAFLNNIVKINGIMIGQKVKQASTLPEFILKDDCPLPIVREFLAGMFGGDGHTCYISKNTFTSISFSKSKNIKFIESLKTMMENIKKLFSRFGINKVTIQNQKINSKSKTRIDEDKNYEIVLHLDISELIPFYEKIGFRYCCHKNQRLEAAVAYMRLRTGITRQKTWICNRINELTNYKELKTQNPTKIIGTTKASKQALEELKLLEPILHPCSIPNGHDILEYLVNEREGGKFPSSKLMSSTEFLKSIGAIDWFNEPKSRNNIENVEFIEDTNLTENTIENIINDSTTELPSTIEPTPPVSMESSTSNYGVNKINDVLPTMNLKVIDIRPGGIHKVYDIQVDKEESFLANGVVAHNCMIAHGAMGFLKERMMDVSDIFTVHICKECGLFSIVNPDDEIGIRVCGGCDNHSQFMQLRIPYACKLLMQELEGMMITPRFNMHSG